jgi:hypothetical protein
MNRQHYGQKKKYKGQETIYKTLHRNLKINITPLKTGDEVGCFGRINSSRVTLVK